MNNVQKGTILFLSALAPFLGLVTRVYAEDIVISGNGSESANTVQTNQDAAVNVSQNNTATVQNNIDVTANTGNNTASDNTGGASSIATGDITVNEGITNTTNVSVVNQNNCCGGQGQITIAGNGAESSSTATHTSSSNNNITSTNNASIANKVNGQAHTGNNKANDNNGNVQITTGNISIKEKISNNSNLSYISASSPLSKDYLLTISGNGSHSNNTIVDDSNSDIVIAVNNTAVIFNNSFWDLVTGNNDASDTAGNVSISTGDIDFDSEIMNNANLSVVVVTCCNKEEEKPLPVVPPEKPVSPKSTDNAQGASASSSGNSNGTSAPGSSLPSTGNMWFFLALIGNIAALIYGTYLRLRSGRSPAYALA